MSTLQVSVPQILIDQVEALKQYASDAYTDADGYIEELKIAALEPDSVVDNVDYNWPEPTLNQSFTTLRPTPSDSDMGTIDDPTRPNLEDLELEEIPSLPVLSAQPPALVFMDEPDTDLPDEPGDVPSVEYPAFPNPEEHTLPEAPTIENVTIEDPPVFEIIPFEGGELPEIEVNPLENTFIYTEGVYQSELLDALKDSLLEKIQSGATGLPEDIEDAMWERARQRTMVEIARTREQIERSFASRGWTMPPGSLQAAITEAIIEETRATADINERIAIKQADITVENMRFFIQAATQLESGLMQHFHQIANRTLDAAKAAAQIGIEVYNANVTRHNLLLDRYKTSAAVLEARIRSGVLALENYKAKIEGARFRVQTQGQYVEVYRAQLAGVQSLMDLYKTQMQAAALKLDVDKLRIEAHKSSVDVYIAKIQAKTATYNLYRSQVEGQVAKAQVFTEEVKAFTEQVRAVAVFVDAAKAKLEAEAIPNEQKLKIYASDIERLKADITKAATEIEVAAKVYGFQVQGYEADVKAATADLDAQTEVWKGRVQQAKNQTDVLLESARQQLTIYVKNREITIEVAKSVANIYAQLAASAMSAVHAGLAYNTSLGGSLNVGESQSISTETRYNHNFEES